MCVSFWKRDKSKCSISNPSIIHKFSSGSDLVYFLCKVIVWRTKCESFREMFEVWKVGAEYLVTPHPVHVYKRRKRQNIRCPVLQSIKDEWRGHAPGAFPLPGVARCSGGMSPTSQEVLCGPGREAPSEQRHSQRGGLQAHAAQLYRCVHT